MSAADPTTTTTTTNSDAVAPPSPPHSPTAQDRDEGSSSSAHRVNRTSNVISEAVMTAIGQLDTKLAFEMMIISEKINTL